MRNPLARLAKRDPSKPSLKQRLAATREKYARTLRVHRALNGPLPKRDPESVDRIALVNYATWLCFERTNVCAELYPHMGRKAARFVLTNNAAERFFYPYNSFNDLRSKAWRDVPPASTRALKVLDLVGVDWQEDTDAESRASLDGTGRQDTGYRPKLPPGWPRLDADLTAALGDMLRLDAAISKISATDGRDFDEMPEYGPLEEARGEVIAKLIHTRAEGFLGLQAKAKAILADAMADEDGKEIAQSLARDLLGASQSVIEPKPDPIFALIEESRRLSAEREATFEEWPHDTSEPAELMERRNALADRLFEHWRRVVLETVPVTARGCVALADYAAAFFDEQGEGDDDHLAVLRLIAQSPAL